MYFMITLEFSPHFGVALFLFVTRQCWHVVHPFACRPPLTYDTEIDLQFIKQLQNILQLLKCILFYVCTE